MIVLLSIMIVLLSIMIVTCKILLWLRVKYYRIYKKPKISFNVFNNNNRIYRTIVFY